MPVRATVLCCWLFATSLLAQAKERTEAEFDIDLARVHELMRQSKWADAKTVLLAVVDGHAGKVYVQAQCDALASDLETCAFFASAKVPTVQDMVHGKILAWDERLGRIKVVYSGDWSDWQPLGGESDGAVEGGGTTTTKSVTTGDFVMNPMVFAGPYSVTLSGKAYPRDPKTVQVLFDVDPSGDGWFQAGFGADLGAAYHLAYVAQSNGDKDPVYLAETRKQIGNPGAPFKALLKVTEGNIETTLDNKSVVKTARTNAEFGSVAIQFGVCDEVVLDGKIEPSSLQTQVDEAVARQREQFIKTFDARKVLPKWVFERPKIARTQPKAIAWVPGLGNTIANDLDQLLLLVAEGKFATAEAALPKLHVLSTSALTNTFLQALLHVRQGRPDAALPLTTKLLVEAPDETTVRLLHAEVLDDIGRGDESLPMLQAAVQADPGYAEGHSQLCVLLMRRGRLDEATRCVREAKTRHGLWEEVGPLEAMLAMSSRGPNWQRRFVHQSPHYEVVSDIDRKVCFEACRVLEQSYVNLMAQLTWIKEDRSLPRFRVFLFSGEEGYQAYNKAILGGTQPHTAGIYSPVLKQLVIWNVPRREDMVRTIRHEGFHQFLDRLMERAPSWFNEGFAEFWETAQYNQGKLVGGQVRKDHIATLIRSRAALPKLRDFVHGSYEDFYGHAQQRYAQAWALVHFIRKGPPVHTARFAKLWTELRAAKSTRTAVDTAFAGLDWDKFEADFWQHLQSLK